MERQDEFDLKELMLALLKKWWIIGLCAMLFATGGFLWSKFFIEPTFEATTSVYVISRQNSETTTYSDMQLGTQLMKDLSVLVASRTVAERVIEKLDLDMSIKELQNSIKVSSVTDTRIMYITVTHTNPVMAQKIADSVRNAAEEHVMKVTDIEAVNVAEMANLPTQKAAPNVGRYTIFAGLVGAALAIAVITVLFLMDDTIKFSDDVEKYLNLSTLATIPYDKKIEKSVTH